MPEQRPEIRNKAEKRETAKPDRLEREQIFELIENENDRSIALKAARRVFEHSVEDGLKLADRLKLTSAELADIVKTLGFAMKHTRILKNILYIAYESDESVESIKANSEHSEILEQLSELTTSFLGPELSKDWSEFETSFKNEQESYKDNILIQEIDGHYAPLLKSRRFRSHLPKSGDEDRIMTKDRRPPEKRYLKEIDIMADEALKQTELLLLPAYYARQVEEILKSYLERQGLAGEPQRFPGDYFTTADEIEAECDRLGIDFTEIKPKLARAKYISITAGLKRAEAKRRLLGTLNDELEMKGLKAELNGDQYEAVEEKKEKEEAEAADGWDDTAPEEGQIVIGKYFRLHGHQFEFGRHDDKFQNWSLFIRHATSPQTRFPVSNYGLILPFHELKKVTRVGHRLLLDCANWAGIGGEIQMVSQTIDLDIEEIRRLEAEEKKQNQRVYADLQISDQCADYQPDKLDNSVYRLGGVKIKLWENHAHDSSVFVDYDSFNILTGRFPKLKRIDELFFENGELKLAGFTEDDKPISLSLVVHGPSQAEADQYFEKIEGGGKNQEAKEFDFDKFEQKSLDYMEKLMAEGARDGLIVQGLAGFDSGRAWQLRDMLLTDGTNSNLILRGLAGVDSDRAWQLRDRLSTETYEWHSICVSLAGLDSERAWQLRDILLTEGVDRSSIARSIIGLDSERAWQLRDRLLAEGANKGNVAQGLAGLDSERAWQLRDRLLADGADKGYVAQGLAGLDSERAWQLRDKLLSLGVDKGLISLGLSGYCLTFVWQLKLKKEKDKVKELSAEEQEQLDLINLLHRPELEAITDYFNRTAVPAGIKGQQRSLENRSFGESRNFANFINRLVGRNPKALLDTMPAKRDRLEKLTGEQLALRIFPELKAIEDKKAWRGFAGYAGFSGGQESRRPADPSDYLDPRSSESLLGGGAEQLGDEREIMELRELYGGILATNIYGAYDKSSNRWQTMDFSVANSLAEPVKEITAIIPDTAGLSEISLPKPLESRIISERVKGYDWGGREFDLKVEMNKLGEAKVVKKPSAVVKVAYTMAVPSSPEPLIKLDQQSYDKHKKKLTADSGASLIENIAELPEDLELELLAAIEGKEPKDQVTAIERLVRDLGYYDENNQEISRLKSGKPLEEQMYIMEQRIEELRSSGAVSADKLAGKMFAGVCADFAQVTAALLRRAGFASGVVRGFSGAGKKVSVKHSHAAAFVVWPDGQGGNRVVCVDGTPDGVVGVSLPSLVEKEKLTEQLGQAESAEAMAEINQIIAGLNKLDEETIRRMSNGELERVVNNILKYQVKESHLAIIQRLFDYYWYTPIHTLDLANPAQKGEAALELAAAVERQRKRLLEQPDKDKTPAGNKLMQMMSDFLARFDVAGAADNHEGAYALMGTILDLTQGELSEVEKKSAHAVLAYLRAKDMIGDKKYL